MTTRQMFVWMTGAAATVGLTVIGASNLSAGTILDQSAQTTQTEPRRSGPGGRGFGRGGGPSAGALLPRIPNLTDDQRAQMRTIAERHRSEITPVMDQLRTAQSALEDAIASNPSDEATIRLRSGEVANAQADLAVIRGRIFSEVLTLLTSEQRQQLQDRRSRMRERLQNRR